VRTCLSAVRRAGLRPATRCDPSFVVGYAIPPIWRARLSRSGAHPKASSHHQVNLLLRTRERAAREHKFLSCRLHLRYKPPSVVHLLESLDARNKSIKSMDPLGVFCMLILGGEVYETFKLLRGSWVTSPIRFFGLLSF